MTNIPAPAEPLIVRLPEWVRMPESTMSVALLTEANLPVDSRDAVLTYTKSAVRSPVRRVVC